MKIVKYYFEYIINLFIDIIDYYNINFYRIISYDKEINEIKRENIIRWSNFYIKYR